MNLRPFHTVPVFALFCLAVLTWFSPPASACDSLQVRFGKEGDLTRVYSLTNNCSSEFVVDSFELQRVRSNGLIPTVPPGEAQISFPVVIPPGESRRVGVSYDVGFAAPALAIFGTGTPLPTLGFRRFDDESNAADVVDTLMVLTRYLARVESPGGHDTMLDSLASIRSHLVERDTLGALALIENLQSHDVGVYRANFWTMFATARKLLIRLLETGPSCKATYLGWVGASTHSYRLTNSYTASGPIESVSLKTRNGTRLKLLLTTSCRAFDPYNKYYRGSTSIDPGYDGCIGGFESEALLGPAWVLLDDGAQSCPTIGPGHAGDNPGRMIDSLEASLSFASEARWLPSSVAEKWSGYLKTAKRHIELEEDYQAVRILRLLSADLDKQFGRVASYEARNPVKHILHPPIDLITKKLVERVRPEVTTSIEPDTLNRFRYSYSVTWPAGQLESFTVPTNAKAISANAGDVSTDGLQTVSWLRKEDQDAPHTFSFKAQGLPTIGLGRVNRKTVSRYSDDVGYTVHVLLPYAPRDPGNLSAIIRRLKDDLRLASKLGWFADSESYAELDSRIDHLTESLSDSTTRRGHPFSGPFQLEYLSGPGFDGIKYPPNVAALVNGVGAYMDDVLYSRERYYRADTVGTDKVIARIPRFREPVAQAVRSRLGNWSHSSGDPDSATAWWSVGDNGELVQYEPEVIDTASFENFRHVQETRCSPIRSEVALSWRTRVIPFESCRTHCGTNWGSPEVCPDSISLVQSRLEKHVLDALSEEIRSRYLLPAALPDSALPYSEVWFYSTQRLIDSVRVVYSQAKTREPLEPVCLVMAGWFVVDDEETDFILDQISGCEYRTFQPSLAFEDEYGVHVVGVSKRFDDNIHVGLGETIQVVTLERHRLHRHLKELRVDRDPGNTFAGQPFRQSWANERLFDPSVVKVSKVIYSPNSGPMTLPAPGRRFDVKAVVPGAGSFGSVKFWLDSYNYDPVAIPDTAALFVSGDDTTFTLAPVPVVDDTATTTIMMTTHYKLVDVRAEYVAPD